MHRPARLLLPALAFAALASATIAQEENETYFVREGMQAEVNPAIEEIWDIGNAAMDESGGLDAAQMDPDKWTALAEAAGALEQSGLAMATRRDLRAAHPSNWATDEFEVTMDQVQALLDADPEGFRRHAAEFAEHSARLRAAAIAQDVAVAGDLIAMMDVTCAECHAQFWYAE